MALRQHGKTVGPAAAGSRPPRARYVSQVIPAGFAACARILHPAYRNTDGARVRWAEVASANGRVAHAEMEWEAVATSGARTEEGTVGPPSAGEPVEREGSGSMPGEIEVLRLGVVGAADVASFLREVGSRLEAAGVVRPGYAKALVAREEAYPTGLRLPGGGVAIPHADAAYALRPAVAVALPAGPIRFRAMDFSAEPVEVRAVVVLVLTDREQQVPWLARLMERMQAPDWLGRVEAATSVEELAELL